MIVSGLPMVETTSLMVWWREIEAGDLPVSAGAAIFAAEEEVEVEGLAADPWLVGWLADWLVDWPASDLS